MALELGSKASLIVCDRGYLRHQKAWRQQVSEDANCRVVQVESDVVVPVEVVTDKMVGDELRPLYPDYHAF